MDGKRVAEGVTSGTHGQARYGWHLQLSLLRKILTLAMLAVKIKRLQVAGLAANGLGD
jgi:hypothetical protein